MCALKSAPERVSARVRNGEAVPSAESRRLFKLKAHTLQPFWILLGQEEQFIEYFLIEIKVGLVLSGIIWHVDKQFLNDILKNYENHAIIKKINFLRGMPRSAAMRQHYKHS